MIRQALCFSGHCTSDLSPLRWRIDAFFPVSEPSCEAEARLELVRPTRSRMRMETGPIIPTETLHVLLYEHLYTYFVS